MDWVTHDHSPPAAGAIGWRLACAALIAFSAATVAFAQGAKAAGPARVPPRIAASTVIEILALQGSYLGLLKSVGDSSAIYVSSNRALIAASNARATRNGGRYNPSPDLLTDMVIISCGDEDLGEQLECSRLTVSTHAGARIQPYGYSAGPQTFRNRLGVAWTVRKVLATFTASQMKKGFIVTAREPDGTEWTIDVSAEDAQKELLLTIGDPPSEPLAVSLQPYGDGWRLWNHSIIDTWNGCVATSGKATAQLGTIIPKWRGSVSLLKFTDFKPPLERRHEPTPTVACYGAGRFHDADVTVEESF